MSQSGTFQGQGEFPTVLSATTPAANVVRVHFSEQMSAVGALTEPGNYTLEPAPGSVSRIITKATPENGVNPTYVDLILDGEMTKGVDNYTITVPAGMVDIAGNAMDPGARSAQFSGRASTLEIVFVWTPPPFAFTRVFFSKAVKQVSSANADDALNPSNYTIAAESGERVTVLAVETVTPNIVQLQASGQIEGHKYTLVALNIQDLSNNVVI